jgi:hypothetical protein
VASPRVACATSPRRGAALLLGVDLDPSALRKRRSDPVEAPPHAWPGRSSPMCHQSIDRPGLARLGLEHYVSSVAANEEEAMRARFALMVTLIASAVTLWAAGPADAYP